ncbi:hypothetical protein LY76DRAFT_10203 [Colletotrichum caudatum]|nr:hypothetical protein LY76DRAFT_10203 [Colletotrichum caudatum]
MPRTCLLPLRTVRIALPLEPSSLAAIPTLAPLFCRHPHNSLAYSVVRSAPKGENIHPHESSTGTMWHVRHVSWYIAGYLASLYTSLATDTSRLCASAFRNLRLPSSAGGFQSYPWPMSPCSQRPALINQ